MNILCEVVFAWEKLFVDVFMLKNQTWKLKTATFKYYKVEDETDFMQLQKENQD